MSEYLGMIVVVLSCMTELAVVPSVYTAPSSRSNAPDGVGWHHAQPAACHCLSLTGGVPACNPSDPAFLQHQEGSAHQAHLLP
jgi:hypothetical protein